MSDATSSGTVVKQVVDNASGKRDTATRGSTPDPPFHKRFCRSTSPASSTGTEQADLFQEALMSAVKKVVPKMIDATLPVILHAILDPTRSPLPSSRPVQNATSESGLLEVVRAAVSKAITQGLIENFQQEVLHEVIANGSARQDFPSDEGITARLLRTCINSIEHLLLSAQGDPACEHLQQSLFELRLWSKVHGAWDGRLDSFLEKSKDLQRTTLSVLNPLCKILDSDLQNYAESDNSVTIQLRVQNSQIYSQTKRLLRAPDGAVSDSDSDDSSSDSDSSDSKNKARGLDCLAKNVETCVQCLSDLSKALETPAIEPEPTEEFNTC